ncbi:WG repeat-containing protein [Streptomyces sp. NPDC093225]|uniref:WG repeat-containing protein n=1 Tax=Streptomyces sp. NPDC093225 TaxID=3366034 RepID=UPI00380C69BA
MHLEPHAPHAVPVDGAAPFGRRFALVDRVGRLVRAPELGAVGPFHPDGEGGFVAPAADPDGAWGYVDGAGRWVVEPAFEHTTEFDGAGLSRFRSHGLWGYVDTTGTRVVPARFTGAGSFHHGLAVVRTEAGAGYADPAGDVVIGGGYRDAGRFGPNGLGAVRVPDGRCGYVDRDGRFAVPPRFDGARPFNTGGTAPVRVGESWGLVDGAGAWVVEPCFRLLNAFDENGLAYAVGGEPGETFVAFVDARGERVLTRDGEMDDALHCGLVKVGDGFARGFRDATGAWAIAADYAWADRFDGGGAAVARAADRAEWGVLRTDGTFVPSPHLEPRTDDDGWVLGFDGGHGTAPFLTVDGESAYVGRDGKDVCRVAVDAADGSAVVLRDAAGGTVWRGTAGPGTFASEPPFLSGRHEAYVDHVAACEGDPGPVVRELLDRPARRFYPCSLIFGHRDDPYDLDELDEYDLERTASGAMHTLASTWLAAESLAEYPFLEDNAQDAFGRIHADVAERLRARYGAPLTDVRHCLRSGDGNLSLVWAVADRHLVLEEYCQVGDGDREFQIWLAVVEA